LVSSCFLSICSKPGGSLGYDSGLGRLNANFIFFGADGFCTSDWLGSYVGFGWLFILLKKAVISVFVGRASSSTSLSFDFALFFPSNLPSESFVYLEE
jgi:hypothetical protein